MAIDQDLAAGGIPYPLAQELTAALAGTPTTAVRLSSLGVAGPLAIELAAQVNGGTKNANALITLGLPSSVAAYLANSSSTLINAVAGAALNFSTMSNAANATQTMFKGRRLYKPAAGLGGISGFTFGFYNWRLNGSNGSGVAEVSGTVPISVIKASVLIRDSTGTRKGNIVPVTKGGQRAFTIPAITARFDFDKVLMTALGTTLLATDDIEFCWLFQLQNGQNTYRMATVANSQGWRFEDAFLVDDIDSDAVMTVNASGGRSQQPITFPNVVCVDRSELPASFKSRAGCSDSLGYGQDGLSSPIASSKYGVSYLSRAAVQAQKAMFNVSIGGRTMRGLLNSPLTLAAIRDVCNCAHLAYLSNDVQFGTTLTQIDADYREAIALMRSWGWTGARDIGASNAQPRTSENNNNATNLYCASDLTQMTPSVTQALAANGFARDGYGFGAGETRDQFNANTLPALKTAGLIGYIIDIASITQDATTTWKWAVPSYTATLTSAAAAATSTWVLSASPPTYTNLVAEPGVANVEPGINRQGGPLAYSVTGSNPFTATLNWANAYDGGTTTGGVSEKAHASGVTVKATLAPDGIHFAELVHAGATSLLSTELAT